MKVEHQVHISGRSLVLAIALVLAAWLAPLIATFVSLSMLALILAAALVPYIDLFVKRFGLKRELAVTAAFVTLMAGAGVVAFLILPTVIDQVRTLVLNLPHYFDKLQGTLAWLQDVALQTGAKFGTKSFVLPPLPDFKEVANTASANASVWVGSSLGIAGKALSFFGMAAVVLMLAFFVLLEGPAVRKTMLSLVPPPQRPLLDAQVDPITVKLGGYVQGMALGIAGLAIYQVAVLSALGLPLALALGLLSALFAIVPLVGGFLGVIVPALVGLSVSWQTSVWALLLGYLGHFIVANFVLPIVFSRSVKLSPLTVTVALLVGAEAMGMFGALVAVPVAAALQVLVQNLYIDLLERRHAPSERDTLKFGEAPLPRLRLQEAEAGLEAVIAQPHDVTGQPR